MSVYSYNPMVWEVASLDLECYKYDSIRTDLLRGALNLEAP